MIKHSVAYKRVMRNVNIACDSSFLLFSIAYLFFFQKDMLIYIGSTLGYEIDNQFFYIGASLLLLLLLLITFIVKKSLRCDGIISSLCFFPSLLIMGVMTSSDFSLFDGYIYSLKWLWLFPTIMIAYILLIVVLKRVLYFEGLKDRGFLSLLNWNITLLFAQFLVTLFIGNTNILFHYQLSADRIIDVNLFVNVLSKFNESVESTFDLIF